MSHAAAARADPPVARYDATARALHWATAALILSAAAMGLWLAYGPEMAEATKLNVYTFHESIGITVLLLALARLARHALRPPPPLDPSLTPAMALAARANHAALYALMIAMPVTGFLATNAWGFPLRWWWLVPLPDPIGRSERWAPVLSAWHHYLAIALSLLVALHAAAALWHHLARRDDTLRRMWPGLGARRPT